MNQRTKLISALPLCLLLAHCGDSAAEPKGGENGASIQTQLALAGVNGSDSAQKFRAGAATAGGLASLKYNISSISICESLEVQGSAFNNPNGCLELYRHDEPALHYGLADDWTPLGNLARASDSGFVDLLSESSRAQLASATALTHDHVRSYNFGIITWALPIKVTATLSMNDGSSLYTHDGESTFETIGVDNFRSYFTRAATPLDRAPAEEAVVLLGNGGNWFKFQSPFVISAEDIDQRRAFVLDLVFNPDGIVKGFSDSTAQGSLSQRDAAGNHLRDITVPMLDLAPVPHRASEQVMRESYQGRVSLDGNSFDLRIELYYVDGDAAGTVFGADVKSLVNADTRSVPPELAKVSFLDRADDGSLSFSAHKHIPTLTGLQRVSGDSGSTHVGLSCATHGDRAAAEGGAAIVVEHCPAPVIDVTLQLSGRTSVAGGVSSGVGEGPDAGPDAGADAGSTP